MEISQILSALGGQSGSQPLQVGQTEGLQGNQLSQVLGAFGGEDKKESSFYDPTKTELQLMLERLSQNG